MIRTIDLPDMHAESLVQGEWATDPPQGMVLPDDPQSEFYERGMGFYSHDLRQQFIDLSIRGGGAGGGGLFAYCVLAKEGARDFSVADVDLVEASNVGRIPCLTPKHIGRRKVDVAAELITEINPLASVRIYGDGINEKNVDEFLGYDADNRGMTIALDEIDLTAPGAARLFHQAARRYGRYVISATDIGRGGAVTVYNPTDQEYTFERYMGAAPSDSQDIYEKRIKGIKLPTLPYLPTDGAYGTLRAVMQGAPAPTTLRSVKVASALLIDEVERLLKREIGEAGAIEPTFSPRMHVVDPSRDIGFYTRHPKRSFLAHLGRAMVNNLTGRSSPASYSTRARNARLQYRASVTDHGKARTQGLRKA